MFVHTGKYTGVCLSRVNQVSMPHTASHTGV
ncbi:hypothetical protein F383_33778 [Gossypium arboreum]|uniref:Uncharacterized protein n=1 Tax=Gossypium arboreum TaxID=29729 RepID=A0A0B0N0N1_GOSAR|nr:hypothetical protein F383_33778 [Gossypium arboreum]